MEDEAPTAAVQGERRRSLLPVLPAQQLVAVDQLAADADVAERREHPLVAFAVISLVRFVTSNHKTMYLSY